jgi:hypothetical protein
MLLQEFTGHQPAAMRSGRYGRPFVVIAMIGSREAWCADSRHGAAVR